MATVSAFWGMQVSNAPGAKEFKIDATSRLRFFFERGEIVDRPKGGDLNGSSDFNPLNEYLSLINASERELIRKIEEVDRRQRASSQSTPEASDPSLRSTSTSTPRSATSQTETFGAETPRPAKPSAGRSGASSPRFATPHTLRPPLSTLPPTLYHTAMPAGVATPPRTTSQTKAFAVATPRPPKPSAGRLGASTSQMATTLPLELPPSASYPARSREVGKSKASSSDNSTLPNPKRKKGNKAA